MTKKITRKPATESKRKPRSLAPGTCSASLTRWCAWCPELGLLLETAHESRFGVRQNVRRQLYWTDKRSWQEIADEGQWHEVEVIANFSSPNAKAQPAAQNP